MKKTNRILDKLADYSTIGLVGALLGHYISHHWDNKFWLSILILGSITTLYHISTLIYLARRK